MWRAPSLTLPDTSMTSGGRADLLPAPVLPRHPYLTFVWPSMSTVIILAAWTRNNNVSAASRSSTDSRCTLRKLS